MDGVVWLVNSSRDSSLVILSLLNLGYPLELGLENITQIKFQLCKSQFEVQRGRNDL
jgi:hypothetical protein